jgi:acyl carrier protein
MHDSEERLVDVFQDVFPDLPAGKIRSATQSSVAGWESVAGIQLMNEVEERFSIVVDYDRAAELTSFALILAYVEERLRS